MSHVADSQPHTHTRQGNFEKWLEKLQLKIWFIDKSNFLNQAIFMNSP